MLIERTVSSWPILGKTTAGVCPQEGTSIPGAARHLSAVKSKSPWVHLLLPLGREKQLQREKGRNRSFSLIAKEGVQKVEWRKAPAPLCTFDTTCASWHLQQHGLPAENEPDWAPSSALLPWVSLETGFSMTQFPHMRNIHSAKYFMKFWGKLRELVLSKPLKFWL